MYPCHAMPDPSIRIGQLLSVSILLLTASSLFSSHVKGLVLPTYAQLFNYTNGKFLKLGQPALFHFLFSPSGRANVKNVQVIWHGEVTSLAILGAARSAPRPVLGDHLYQRAKGRGLRAEGRRGRRPSLSSPLLPSALHKHNTLHWRERASERASRPQIT